MDANRILKRLLVIAVAFLGLVITVSAVSGPGEATPGRSSGAAVYSHNELQRAANMTQQMSTPNANTDSPYHTGDEQLQRSSNSGYVRAVEQHQADIDRMLARGTP